MILVRMMRHTVLTQVSPVQVVDVTMLIVVLLAARVTVVSKFGTLCHPAALRKKLLCISMSTTSNEPAYLAE